MKNKRVFQKTLTVGGGAVTVGIFLALITNFVLKTHNESGAAIKVPSAVEAAEFTGEISFQTSAPSLPQFPPDAVLPTGVRTYAVQPGDTLDELATRFVTTSKDLKKLNGIRDADKISTGQIIIYLDPASRGVNNAP